MSKSYKRYEASYFDDDKYEKRAKGSHLKHMINKQSHEDIDFDDVDEEWKNDVEYFMKKWK